MVLASFSFIFLRLFLLKIAYLLKIVAFSCGRGSDCNRDTSSVSFPRHSLYFYCIFIVFLLYNILSDEFIKLNKLKKS